MYKLLPWKWICSGLAVVVAVAVYADELGRITGVVLPDHLIVRYLPLILVALLTTFFGSTGWRAPWRWTWRTFPFLNTVIFPDLNGVWVGSTISNWPTLKKMLDASQGRGGITQDELHSTPGQIDAMAVQIKASLFRVQITAGLSATNGQSHSITVRPWKDAHNRLHLTYVYEQNTPDPAMTDVETHLGAAELMIDMDDFEKAEGIYWTRRNWQKGLNTAGRLDLCRIEARKNRGKTLREYANEQREQSSGT